MPGVHREKECPICKKIHRGRWPSCSRACGIKLRSSRPVTEEARLARKAGLKKWGEKNPEFIERITMNLPNVDDEETCIIPPSDEECNFFVEDGDVWHNV